MSGVNWNPLPPENSRENVNLNVLKLENHRRQARTDVATEAKAEENVQDGRKRIINDTARNPAPPLFLVLPFSFPQHCIPRAHALTNCGIKFYVTYNSSDIKPQQTCYSTASTL